MFSRPVAYLSLATGVLGTVSEALKPLLGPGYIVYGLLLFVWLVAIGLQLYRLGTDWRGGALGDLGGLERDLSRLPAK
ncbi:MAG TPA: hypothetical protein VFZ25_21495 [Chloroflexota bacterium]|nr:hypothetical protein [Chloroflexota bacterium]